MGFELSSLHKPSLMLFDAIIILRIVGVKLGRWLGEWNISMAVSPTKVEK
jgi:hypothetical protein